jgi:hypothetical protein
VYCCDSDSIITAWRDTYPPDVAPGFWEQLEAQIVRGTLIAPEEVRGELLAPEDLKRWAAQREPMFRELDDELQEAVRGVVRFIQADARRKGLRLKNRDFKADPFVVALARLTQRTVVTQERPNNDPLNGRLKLPDVCGAFGVRYTNMLGLMREVGIRLR